MTNPGGVSVDENNENAGSGVDKFAWRSKKITSAEPRPYVDATGRTAASGIRTNALQRNRPSSDAM